MQACKKCERKFDYRNVIKVMWFPPKGITCTECSAEHKPAWWNRFILIAPSLLVLPAYEVVDLIFPNGLRIVFSNRTPMSSVAEVVEKLCGSTGTK